MPTIGGKHNSGTELSSISPEPPSKRVKREPSAIDEMAKMMCLCAKEMSIFGLGEKYIKIKDAAHSIRCIGQGKEHRVFAFSEDVQLKLGDKVFNTANIVLKQLHSGSNHRKKLEESWKNSMAAYDRLQKMGVNVPQRYSTPESEAQLIAFYDKLEELPKFCWADKSSQADFEAALKNDLKGSALFMWVKDLLTATAKDPTNKRLGDFCPRNVMQKSTESGPVFYVVDYARVDDEQVLGSQEAWKVELYGFLKAWSDGSLPAFEALIADYPADVQASMRQQLKAYGL